MQLPEHVTLETVEILSPQHRMEISINVKNKLNESEMNEFSSLGTAAGLFEGHMCTSCPRPEQVFIIFNQFIAI